MWAFASWRTSDDPLCDEGSPPALRTPALIRAPLAFKRRNIFPLSVDLPLAFRAGRPLKSAEEKRNTNAESQRRFRASRREELAALRRLARKNQMKQREEGSELRRDGPTPLDREKWTSYGVLSSRGFYRRPRASRKSWERCAPAAWRETR